jgi:hypothetical protein
MHGECRAILVVAFASAALSGCQGLASRALAHGEVQAAHRTIAEAFSTCDEAAFLNAYADAFTFTTSHTRQAVTSRDGLRAYLAQGCGISPHPTASVRQQSIGLVGAEAIATGQYLFRVPAGGKVVDLVQNFTVVFVNVRGAWKVVAHHVSVSP